MTTKKTEEGNGVAMRIAMMIGSLGMIILCLICFVALIKCSGKPIATECSVRDTIKVVVYDTILYYQPEAKDSAVVRYITELLPVVTADSLINRQLGDSTGMVVCDSRKDSVDVVLPITQKHYEDSTYSAWVSGYNPSLDSIMVYPRTEIRTITIETKESKRWRLGISGGFGIVHDGTKWHCGPGVNVGVVCSF